jgi:uncharacterized protein (UPF0147 family)
MTDIDKFNKKVTLVQTTTDIAILEKLSNDENYPRLIMPVLTNL